MWLCLLSTAKGLPTPRARVTEMRDAQARNEAVRLILPAKAKEQFVDAATGESVVFGVRQGGKWSVHGRGRIAGEIALVELPATAAGEPTTTVCACPLDTVEFYEPPRDESAFGLPEGSWPAVGRPYATWVDDPVSGVGHCFARTTVPRGLFDEGKLLDSATPLGRERYFEGRGLLDLMRAIQSV